MAQSLFDLDRLATDAIWLRQLGQLPPDITLPFIERVQAWMESGPLGERRNRYRLQALPVLRHWLGTGGDQLADRWADYMIRRNRDLVVALTYYESQAYFAECVQVDQPEILRGHQEQGVIFVAPHWGPYLAAAIMLGREGALQAVVDPTVAAILSEGVRLWDLKKIAAVAIPDAGHFLNLGTLVGRGRSLMVFADHSYGRATHPIRVRMMGTELDVALDVILLAHTTRVPLVPVWMEYGKGTGRFTLHVESPIPVPAAHGADLRPAAEMLFRWIERVVMIDPALWWTWSQMELAERNPAASP